MPRDSLITCPWRYGTSAMWSVVNPVLDAMEYGVEWTGKKYLLKLGDGVLAWNDLPYAFLGSDFSIGTSLPASPSNGDKYFLTTTGKLYLAASGVWALVGGFGGAATLAALISPFTVTNTSNETTVFSGIVPSGSIGTSTATVRIDSHGYLTQSTIVGLAASLNFTIRIKYGSQTFVAMSNLASRVATIVDDTAVFEMEVRILMRNSSSSSQSIYSKIQQAAATGPFQLAADGGVLARRGTLSVDSTIDQPLVVTVQPNNIVATTSLIVEQARLIRVG